MDSSALLVFVFNLFRNHDSRSEGQQRKQIVHSCPEISHHQVLAHEYYIARLRICEYVIPYVVSICVL